MIRRERTIWLRLPLPATSNEARFYFSGALSFWAAPPPHGISLTADLIAAADPCCKAFARGTLTVEHVAADVGIADTLPRVSDQTGFLAYGLPLNSLGGSTMGQPIPIRCPVVGFLGFEDFGSTYVYVQFGGI